MNISFMTNTVIYSEATALEGVSLSATNTTNNTNNNTC